MRKPAPVLTEEALELLRNFQELSESERARILALVKNLRALGEVVALELPLKQTATLLS